MATKHEDKSELYDQSMLALRKYVDEYINGTITKPSAGILKLALEASGFFQTNEEKEEEAQKEMMAIQDELERLAKGR